MSGLRHVETEWSVTSGGLLNSVVWRRTSLQLSINHNTINPFTVTNDDVFVKLPVTCLTTETGTAKTTAVIIRHDDD